MKIQALAAALVICGGVTLPLSALAQDIDSVLVVNDTPTELKLKKYGGKGLEVDVNCTSYSGKEATFQCTRKIAPGATGSFRDFSQLTFIVGGQPCSVNLDKFLGSQTKTYKLSELCSKLFTLLNTDPDNGSNNSGDKNNQ